jgi:hypothetical protein
MILVLDPEFSAEEIRTAKRISVSKNCKGSKKGRTRKIQELQGPRKKKKNGKGVGKTKKF